MFRSTVIESNSADAWNKKPMCRRTATSSRSLIAETSWSLKNTLPESGFSSPTIVFSRTLLPQPLGPMTTVV